MKKPIIGVTPLWDDKKGHTWMHSGYLDGIIQAGGLPMILPFTIDNTLLEQICQTVDGLLFTGGQDIFPGLYGQEVSPVCGEICSIRDNMESALFTKAVL
ncbi:MAG: gamma-glutamyl-gamma-aminobutyrate hydrolase family protein, partial [Defluviitaleaceae bacterium]|nr:gamma-glutamyl-gamma-aminobutyrate hydrolase family protein [Defluviitaleaceae bacterium]